MVNVVPNRFGASAATHFNVKCYLDEIMRALRRLALDSKESLMRTDGEAHEFEASELDIGSLRGLARQFSDWPLLRSFGLLRTLWPSWISGNLRGMRRWLLQFVVALLTLGIGSFLEA